MVFCRRCEAGSVTHYWITFLSFFFHSYPISIFPFFHFLTCFGFFYLVILSVSFFLSFCIFSNTLSFLFSYIFSSCFSSLAKLLHGCSLSGDRSACILSNCTSLNHSQRTDRTLISRTRVYWPLSMKVEHCAPSMNFLVTSFRSPTSVPLRINFWRMTPTLLSTLPCILKY